MTPSSAKSSSSRSNSEYADVADLFRELREVPEDSAQFQRQRDRIVERCLPLADHIARRFDGRGEPRDDLVQVARVGLVNAVIRFDVNAGSDFVSFAVPTIMGEVRRHFRDNSWSVKVPRRLKELHLRLGAATADLSQRLGRAPTASELAAELDMDRDEVVEGLVAGSSYNTLSIDSGGSGNEDVPAIADTLGDRRHRPRPDREPGSVAPVARCATGAGAYRTGAQVLRVADADADRRAGRHLTDARLPLACEIPSATARPAAVADCGSARKADSAASMLRQIGNAESGSQMRSRRVTAALGTNAQSTFSPAQRTLTVCSAEKPAVPKNSTPDRSSTSRCVFSALRIV